MALDSNDWHAGFGPVAYTGSEEEFVDPSPDDDDDDVCEPSDDPLAGDGCWRDEGEPDEADEESVCEPDEPTLRHAVIEDDGHYLPRLIDQSTVDWNTAYHALGVSPVSPAALRQAWPCLVDYLTDHLLTRVDVDRPHTAVDRDYVDRGGCTAVQYRSDLQCLFEDSDESRRVRYRLLQTLKTHFGFSESSVPYFRNGQSEWSLIESRSGDTAFAQYVDSTFVKAAARAENPPATAVQLLCANVAGVDVEMCLVPPAGTRYDLVAFRAGSGHWHQSSKLMPLLALRAMLASPNTPIQLQQMHSLIGSTSKRHHDYARKLVNQLRDELRNHDDPFFQALIPKISANKDHYLLTIACPPMNMVRSARSASKSTPNA